MTRTFFLIALLPLSLSAEPDRTAAIRQAVMQEMTGKDGAFVLIHSSTGEVADSNPECSAKRLPPCSTFKIWNALIGFEEGLLSDSKEAFYQWDGETRSISGWNRDLTRAAVGDGIEPPSPADCRRRIYRSQLVNRYLDISTPSPRLPPCPASSCPYP